MSENQIVSVKKKELLDLLWENNVRVRDQDFEEKARHHLHELLNLPVEECSIATNEKIANEAMKFRLRLRQFWGTRKAGTPKLGNTKAALDGHPYFQQDIEVEVVPVVQEIPDMAPPPIPKRSGPYKSYSEKLPDAQRLDRAAVRNSHDGWAILDAAPKVATSLGQGIFGKAIKEMAKDLDVNPQLALDGMKNQSMY